MTKAENKTNSSPDSVNSVNLTTAEQIMSSSDLSNETFISSIMPASQTENQGGIDCATFASEFEISKDCLAALVPSHRLELVTLIQVLHSSNGNLSERVTQLEQALTDCLKALQIHKKYSRVTKSMLTQKTQELAATQEQIKCLSEETAASHQTIQLQQTLIASLTAELQNSQERFAQLEWEHYLTQANYKEQSGQMIQTEHTCQELRTRLKRQQYYTLQLKVALEKCLETSASKYQSKVDIEHIPTDLKSEQQPQVQSFFSKAESISPWSAQLQFVTEDVQVKLHQPSTLNWLDKDLSSSIEIESIPALETDEVVVLDAWINFSQQRYSTANSVCDYSSIPPLAKLIETITDAGEIQSLNQDITRPEEEWQDLLPMLKSVQVNATSDTIPFPAINASAQLDQPLNDANTHLIETSSESSLDNTTQIQSTPPQQETSTSNSNWPSPLIYPSHLPKRRKSLAAIELPSFTSIRGRDE